MSEKVRLAIVGVGNCASALVQGIDYYRGVGDNEKIAGLMHVRLGNYHIDDIEFSSAFDVNTTKVGHNLAEAIYAHPNNTHRFARAKMNGVTVLRGPTLDGLGKYAGAQIEESAAEPVNVAETLKRSGTDVLVSYLPVGSQKATEFYAEEALKAGVGFVNCIPVFIASNDNWRRRFEDANLPLIGDDIKSQVGATITHRVLANLFRERGVRLDRTYQLNVGGNYDFMNMLERERLETKKISKTQAVTSQLDHEIGSDNVHIGPSDYIPWLSDRKVAYIRLEGAGFGDVPIACEMRLEVWDSPNSAGVVIDAVRCAKLAIDRGIGGALTGPSSYFMKSPPQQFDDQEAQKLVEEFIAGK
jgi:myo-inositol-1-phosphate synthase